MPSLPEPITTVIFDFDGVLADTERLHLAAFQQVFGERGWRLDPATYFERYLGYHDHGLVLAFARENGLQLDTREVHDLLALKAETFDRMVAGGDVLFPAARACVRDLAAHYTLGIASGALRSEIVTILEAAGLQDAFGTIVGAEDVRACKPDPEPYLTAAGRLGVHPGRCVAIEDSPPGLQAAHAAGLWTVGVTTTMPPSELTRADRIIGNLTEFTPELVRAFGAARAL